MWRRGTLAAALVVLELPILAVLVVGWLVTGFAYKSAMQFARVRSWRKRGMVERRSRLAASMKVLVMVVAVLAVGGAWLFSHLHPSQFGICHVVALQIGRRPTARECVPFGTPDFVTPLAIIVGLVLVFGDGNFKLSIPGLGTWERTRVGKEAAQALQDSGAEFDRRAAEYERAHLGGDE